MSSPNDRVQEPFTYLAQDHKKVAELLKELSGTTERAEKTRDELFAKLYEGLSLHAQLEEAVLYPALEKYKQTHEITEEAFQEHHIVKILLEEMKHLSPTTEEWSAKLKVLKENVEHHVEEEENDMFKKAQKALDEDERRMLAEEMQLFLASLL